MGTGDGANLHFAIPTQHKMGAPGPRCWDLGCLQPFLIRKAPVRERRKLARMERSRIRGYPPIKPAPGPPALRAKGHASLPAPRRIAAHGTLIVSFSDPRPFLVLSPNSSRVRFRSVPNSRWATPTALSTVLEYLVRTHPGPRCRHEKRLLCPDDQLEKLSVAPLLEISSLCPHCPPPPDTACVPSP